MQLLLVVDNGQVTTQQNTAVVDIRFRPRSDVAPGGWVSLSIRRAVKSMLLPVVL